MVNKKFAKKLDEMKATKKNKRNNASKKFAQNNKQHNKYNKHHLKLPNITQKRKSFIKPPTNMILQVHGHIEIKMYKQIFVDKIGEENKKEEKTNTGEEK